MSQMLSIWRGVTDQLTPRASNHSGAAQERNPFDEGAGSGGGAATSRGGGGKNTTPGAGPRSTGSGPSTNGHHINTNNHGQAAAASSASGTTSAAAAALTAVGGASSPGGTTGPATPGPTNGFSSSRKVSFPHLHLHHLSAAVSGNLASRRAAQQSPSSSTTPTPTAAVYNFEPHDGSRTPLARSPNAVLTPTATHHGIAGAGGGNTPGAGGSFFGHARPGAPPSSSRSSSSDRIANSTTAAFASNESPSKPSPTFASSVIRPSPARSSSEQVRSASSTGQGGGSGNMTGLKAPQTTSVSKTGPDFTFKASPISRAKNALRDSVSNTVGGVSGGNSKASPQPGPSTTHKDATNPSASAPLVVAKSPTAAFFRSPAGPSNLSTALAENPAPPARTASPSTPKGASHTGSALPPPLTEDSPVGSAASSSSSNHSSDHHHQSKDRPTSSKDNSALPPPRGQLSVKLVSARNLASLQSARPYVVAAYDSSEFVSREPIPEEEEEAKGVAASKLRERKDTTMGTDGKGPPAPTPGKVPGAGGVMDKGAEKENAGKVVVKGNRESNGNGLFCLSGQNPIWKHEVTFDVVGTPRPSMAVTGEHASAATGSLASSDNVPQAQAHVDSRSLLVVNIYDRSVGDDEEGGVEGLETFLGEAEIVLDFEKMKASKDWLDDWYPLRPRGDGDNVRGDIRLQLRYKEFHSRRGLSVDDFDFLKMIGRGTFGRVFQVRKKDTRRIYAMKVLSKKEVIAKKEVQHTLGERNILQRSSECPFLLGLKFSFQSPGELFLVMDYKSGGELFHHLQKEGRFTEDRARFYTAEIVLAFEHLHKYDIVYRDLKPENILLDATGHIVLCDFGLSKPDLPSDALTTTFCGTTEYLAPEVLLDDHGYSKLVDFWSLGVLLFEMCCGWSPFYAEDTQQMYKNICFGKIKFPRGVIGDEGKQFVKGLLNRNPRHRLGAQRDAQELKEHAFFRTIDWVALEARQVAPPFKPFVDSDESVANFDAEFTEADILKEMPMPAIDEADRSDDWLKHASVPISSPREMPQHRRRSQDSMSEQFRGFSYAGESEMHLGSSHGSHHSAHEMPFGGSRFAMTSIK